jgi:hypothetical protein
MAFLISGSINRKLSRTYLLTCLPERLTINYLLIYVKGIDSFFTFIINTALLSFHNFTVINKQLLSFFYFFYCFKIFAAVYRNNIWIIGMIQKQG